MAKFGSTILQRLFGKPPAPAPVEPEAPRVTEPTVGLCFDYERGLAYASEYLSDAGLESIMKELQRLKLRATFHCPSKLCETAPARIESILQAGHEVSVLGYAEEKPAELTLDGLRQLIFVCRNAFGNRGLSPIGFRSPRSQWDERLSNELPRARFVYSAEHDHAKQPYYLTTAPPPLLRIPIRTDDSYLRGRKEKQDLAIAKHHRVVRKAIQGRYFVAICFHPWILAEDPQRLQHWQEWLDAALQAGAKAVALQDILPANSGSAGQTTSTPP